MNWSKLFPFRLRRSRRHNQRRFQRLPHHAPAHCGADRLEPARTTDLSEGGVGLLSEEPLAVGSSVAIAFLNMSVSVSGTVRAVKRVHPSRFRVGVEFDQPQGDIVDVLLRCG